MRSGQRGNASHHITRGKASPPKNVSPATPRQPDNDYKDSPHLSGLIYLTGNERKTNERSDRGRGIESVYKKKINRVTKNKSTKTPYKSPVMWR